MKIFFFEWTAKVIIKAKKRNVSQKQKIVQKMPDFLKNKEKSPVFC
jgi:hypothetical protein